jgi:hypothetical protein
MATATFLPTPSESAAREIRLYSHSPIFYWRPVWLVGFVLALVTYLDGMRMALVPPGTEARRDWVVEAAPGERAIREGLLLPRSEPGQPYHLPPEGDRNAGAALPPPEQPHVRMASSQYLGSIFVITLLVVFVCSNVPLRGLWEWIAVLAIGLVISLVAVYGWWGSVMEWFGLLHMYINMACYVFLSTWLFALWAVTVFFFDTRTHIILCAGQVRIRQEIGHGEKIYDVTNMTFQVQPNAFLRHRVLGLFGAGDLVVRTGGPQSEVIDWPNVLFVRRRLKQIEHMLHSREVVEEVAAKASGQ